MTPKISTAYVAWTNTDLTEGRGSTIPLCVCETFATAVRLGAKGSVQGSDCNIGEVDLLEHKGLLYGPIHLRIATKEDLKEQRARDAQILARNKAKMLGMSDEEIEALRS